MQTACGTSARSATRAASVSVPGMFANANAGDPTKWTYVADTTRPAVNAASYRMMSLRLTAQVTPRNKFDVFWDEQKPCEGGAAAGCLGQRRCRTSGDDRSLRRSRRPRRRRRRRATLAPETAAYRDFGNRVYQAKWTAPVTNRLLLESRHGAYRSRWGGKEMPGSKHRGPDSRRRAVRGRLRANGSIPG